MFTDPSFELYGKTGTLESAQFEPLSLFLFGGRSAPTVSKATAACPVVGIVYVEEDRGATTRLTGVSLFADVVAPVLRERFGWDGAGCLRPRDTAAGAERGALVRRASTVKQIANTGEVR
jgi:hypothetical protein